MIGVAAAASAGCASNAAFLSVLARVLSRAIHGVTALPVIVEVHITGGLPSLTIVGLPEAAVRESRDRVRSALINSGFEFPSKRVTINLAPADLPKEGGRYDLAIALGILAASGQIPAESLDDFEVQGELSLSGELRTVTGMLPSAVACREAKRNLLVPADCAEQAALISTVAVYGAPSLAAVCKHLTGLERISETVAKPQPSHQHFPDLADVKGQHQGKRALEIAAAGGHNLLLVGPPGTGKSMLASRLGGILPPMTETEALETASVWSVSHQRFDIEQYGVRPFRQPHHTASAVALVGGGSQPKPGEISLAHNGVLFLDELSEFDRRVLEVLREPLETGRIHISRAAQQAEFPANFQLVAAMNPPESGGSKRLSAPFLDRIDLHLEIPRQSAEVMADTSQSESSATVRARVVAAREKQLARAGVANAALQGKQLDALALDKAAEQLLQQAGTTMGFSGRAYHRALRVARTIADLNGTAQVTATDVAEAVSLRGKLKL